MRRTAGYSPRDGAPCSLSAALATYWVIRVQRFLGFKARKAANLSSLPLTIRLYFA